MSFHVPEYARIRSHPQLGTTEADGNNGAFSMGSPEPGWDLWLIASDGEGWEHVSVHAWNGKRERTPSWREMCFVKSLFWDPEDEAVQFHPAASEYVNCHPHTLHIWRPIGRAIEMPPADLVGPR